MSDNLKFTFKAWAAITAITIGLCFLTQLAATLLGVELPDQANIAAVKELLSKTFADMQSFKRSMTVIAMVLAIMPVVEEFAFRWFGYYLYRKKAPAWVGYVRAFAASVLFSAAHYLQQPFPDNAFIALFFFGLAQCWLYRKTGSVRYPIICHALFNLTNLVLVLAVPQA